MKRSRDEFDNDFDSLSPASHQESSAPSPKSSVASAKIVHLSQEATSPTQIMRCSLPGHRELFFSTYDEYESHYNQSHLWKCSECERNFPSEHYLGLHIEEHHDSMAQIRKERGERIYSCFVEDCDRKCSAPHKRQMHLIDKHLFPKDYDFQIIRTGIDHRSSMLKSGRARHQNRNQKRNGNATELVDERAIVSKRPDDCGSQENSKISSTGSSDEEEKMDEDNQTLKSSALPSTALQSDTDMDDLAGAMSSLRFVPPSIRFGRGGGRGKGRGGLSRN